MRDGIKTRFKILKQITINAYELKELKPEARQKAINKQIEFENSVYDFKEDEDYFKEKWAEMGIDNAEFKFDLYQDKFILINGDINHPKIAKALKLSTARLKAIKLYLILDRGTIEYETDFTYQESVYQESVTEKNGTTHKEGDDISQKDRKLIENTRELINQAITDKEKECLKALRDIEDDLNSEERAIESIEINEYLFDEYGDIIR